MTREEAIKEIRSWAIPSKNGREVLETLIPELVESEDERVRRELIEFIQWSEDRGMTRHDFHQAKRPSEWIDYLEKQKENTWSEEDDEKVKVMCKEGDLKPSERAWLKDLRNRVWKEQKPAEIDEYEIIKKHITHDSLSSEVNKRLKECGWYVTEEPVKWEEEDQKSLNRAINICISDFGEDCQTAKFLKSLPKRFNLQSMQEWSEEDEKDIAHIIRILDDCYAYGKHDLSKTDHENLINTLKSLCPHWKPSEHQMTILKAVKDYVGVGSGYWGEVLGTLIEDLEKL